MTRHPVEVDEVGIVTQGQFEVLKGNRRVLLILHQGDHLNPIVLRLEHDVADKLGRAILAEAAAVTARRP